MEDDDIQHTPPMPDSPAADTQARDQRAPEIDVQPSEPGDPAPEPSSDELDVVDFQSMQSFPASDVPAWPTPAALNRPGEQG